MASVTPIEDVRVSPRAAKFEGGEDAQVSIFVTRNERGEGPDLHFHPYAETFVVQRGRAIFTAGEERIEVGPGNIVVVPAETVHGFKNAGDEPLEVVSVHPSPHVIQTDL